MGEWETFMQTRNGTLSGHKAPNPIATTLVAHTLFQGSYKEMSSIFADQYVIRDQMRGEGGVAGSQPMSTAVHIT